MARTTAKVTELKIDHQAILAKVTASGQYVSKIRAFAERRAGAMERVAEEHYQGAIKEIQDLLEDGISGAAAPMSRLFIETPANGRVAVGVNWAPLHPRWLSSKANRSRPGYTPTRGSVRSKHPKGRSYGANSFWLDEKKFLSAYRSRVSGQGTVSVDLRMREMKGGSFELRLELRLNKLPARYLDRAIRRSLIKGAGGTGSLGGLIEIPRSELTSSTNSRGLARGGWPEQMRPLMRPIAQRLGRAMQKQILKTLNRS